MESIELIEYQKKCIKCNRLILRYSLATRYMYYSPSNNIKFDIREARCCQEAPEIQLTDEEHYYLLMCRSCYKLYKKKEKNKMVFISSLLF